MCGISGIINPSGFIVSELFKMTNIIKHRGPDDEGYVVFKNIGEPPVCLGGSSTPREAYLSAFSYKPTSSIESFELQKVQVAFGHRRLSILDLSPAGHQPMSYANGKYWIVLNGEIFNYIEVRQNLLKLGYQFISNSDTEVILAAYEEWGIDCQHHFNGMWAFVIFDCEKNEIFMSRDRFGIKPLYYYFAPNDSFLFGSEIKQFTVYSGWEAILNHQRAYDYLLYALTDHTDETMFQGVYHLPAGCYYKTCVSDLKPNNKKKINYLKWYSPSNDKYKGTFEEAKEKFGELFKSAVNLHLRSDVRVGSALSGGLDSSAIVSYVNILLKNQGKADLQKTFSSCSTDLRFDEKKWIDEVVKYTKVDASYVYPNGVDVFNLSERILWHQDEPYQSQSVFLGYKVFEMAKDKQVFVLLNGQGADEYLSGYGALRSLRLIKLLKEIKLKQLLSEYETNSPFQSSIKLIKLVISATVPRLIKRILRDRLYYYKLKNNFDFDILKVNGSNKNPLPFINTAFEISQHKLLHDPLPRYLRWEDRNSMAHSIEARVPFLDYRLVEFTTQLPIEYLDKKNESKRILINALKGIIPEVIRNRKDKKGFITPEQRWFTEDYKKDFLELFEKNVDYSQGIINKTNTLKYLKKMQNGVVPFNYNYWRLISFCIWMKVFKVKI